MLPMAHVLLVGVVLAAGISRLVVLVACVGPVLLADAVNPVAPVLSLAISPRLVRMLLVLLVGCVLLSVRLRRVFAKIPMLPMAHVLLVGVVLAADLRRLAALMACVGPAILADPVSPVAAVLCLAISLRLSLCLVLVLLVDLVLLSVRSPRLVVVACVGPALLADAVGHLAAVLSLAVLPCLVLVLLSVRLGPIALGGVLFGEDYKVARFLAILARMIFC